MTTQGTGCLYLAPLRRHVEIPLSVYDQLVAWRADPNGGECFVLPPVDIDGLPVVLRVYRDDVAWVGH